MPSFVNKVYFWFSLIFLIIRTLAVSLFASYIHDESKKPVTIIRAIPQYSWCLEAHRFSEEVVNRTIALSGLKFFYLTRQIILVVSYGKFICKRKHELGILYFSCFRLPELSLLMSWFLFSSIPIFRYQLGINTKSMKWYYYQVYGKIIMSHTKE